MTRIIKADTMANHAEATQAMLNLADFAADAKTIVLDARKDAARIVAEARAKSDSIQRQARRQGFTEGFAGGQSDGHTDGLQQAKTEAGRKYARDYASTLALAKDVINGLSNTRKETLRDTCDEILELAVLLARRIVHRIADTDMEAAKNNLAKALELAHYDGQIVVKVNPSQLEALHEYFSELVDVLSPGGEARLVGDECISRGGVKLVSPHGLIDATIEKQLDNAAYALLGRRVEADCDESLDEPTEMGRYQSSARMCNELLTG